MVIFFNEPFVAVTGDNSKVFCGPKIDWPFYNNYNFLFEFEEKISIKEYTEKCILAKGSNCEIISNLMIGDKKVLLVRESKIEYQCPVYKYIVFGSNYNCTLKYPDCGGIVDDNFRKKADQSVRLSIKNLFFTRF